MANGTLEPMTYTVGRVDSLDTGPLDNRAADFRLGLARPAWHERRRMPPLGAAHLHVRDERPRARVFARLRLRDRDSGRTVDARRTIGVDEQRQRREEQEHSYPAVASRLAVSIRSSDVTDDPNPNSKHRSDSRVRALWLRRGGAEIL
jgi:hypothetical protein